MWMCDVDVCSVCTLTGALAVLQEAGRLEEDMVMW